MTALAYSEPEPKIIHGVKDDWEIVIGMEVHAQVASKAKLFSGASTRFGAAESGGTYAASLLDLMEHTRNGRLLVYDPETGRATTLLDGLSFANGVAVSPDQSFVLVNETGEYRVIRHCPPKPVL